MPNQVIKADGSKQSFDEVKLKSSIEAAAKDADLPHERTQELVEQVSLVALNELQGDEVATTDIKAVILQELDKVEPSVSEAWRNHNKNKEEE